MSELKKYHHQLIQIDRLIDNYQQHPSMNQVQILKLRLKQEKLRDRVVYQSLKEKIAK